MSSTTRLLNSMFLGAIAVAISACANPAVQECGATGVLCPAGTHCAAAQGICLPDSNTCGDAHLDPGEVCDDGNTIDGDGCSADCLSNEKCGNGTLDKPIKDAGGNVVASDPRNEDCDTPGAIDPTSGFFCSALCKFEKCGNHVVDKEIGEVCDDGNTVGADGCSADCKSTEICGNGIVDREVGEVCDPPGVNGCSADCRSTGLCGNGIVDTDKGEECDDGIDQGQARHNGDDQDCRSDCVINRCGDGRINLHGTHHEDCDGGPTTMDHIRTAVPTEKADCNIDCTAPKCGDGKVNRSFKPDGTHGEQCDNGTGVNADDADCTANCQRNVCGDGFPNTAGPLHIEGCDDGNQVDTDTCTNACRVQTCGDGVVHPDIDPTKNEECDLGPANSDTGPCLTNCHLAKCGDGKIEAGFEQCDPPNPGHGCSANCQTETCGNGVIDPGEECDKGTLNDDNGDCRTDCIINRCGDGFVNTHGTHPEACEGLATPVGHGVHTVTPIETANCNINCTLPACGDGILNRHFVPTKLVGGGAAQGPEQCDDGARDNGPNNGDGCSADCQFEFCGNGIKDPGEECDGTPGCSSTCFLQRCGNGIVDPGEECDNGNANADDADCRSDCVINRCGDGHVNTAGTNKEECDGGPVAGMGDRTASPTNKSDCNSNCKKPSCGDGVVNPLFVAQLVPPTVPANTLPEQCDPPGPGCSAICRLENCGNHVVDPGEQCDDGNTSNGDGCENDCTLPRCGNGFKDAGEECDDGNSNNADDCTNQCKFARCGDGFVRTSGATPPVPPTVVEQCDTALGPTACAYDPVSKPCSLCVACVLTPTPAPFCGDGNTDQPFETCDSRNKTCGACTANCQQITSQQASGLIFAAAGKDLSPNPAANDTFTVSDGFTTPTTFEFTLTTVNTAGNFPVLFTAADTNAIVAGEIADAIAARRSSGGLQIVATRVGGVVTLTNDRASSLGNGTTGTPRLVGHVATTNFAVVDMAGGQGGNCAAAQPCAIDDDCASGTCLPTHICQ